MKRIITGVLLVCMILVIPAHVNGLGLEEANAGAVLLMEQSTGEVIYEVNGYDKMYPASTTKVLTALVALDYSDIDDIVTVGNEVYTVPLDASKAGHVPGEEIYLKNLIKALMLPSGNDTAFTVANHTVKKVTGNENIRNDEAVAIFSNLMNEKAKEIGAVNSNFVNPHGYHEEAHYSTAYDLALIMQEAMKNEDFRRIQSLPFINIEEGELENQQSYYWNNRNLLLRSSFSQYYYSNATGGKTGYTGPAGECLISTASKDGMDLIAVVLDAPENKRWAISKILFEHGFNDHTLHNIAKENEVIQNVSISNASFRDEGNLDVKAKEDLTKVMKNENIDNIKEEIIWDAGYISNESTEEISVLTAPINKGDILGTATYTLDGETLGVVDLIADRTVKKQLFIFTLFSIRNLLYLTGGLLLVALFIAIRNKRNRRRRNSTLRFR
ncbi:D-alanyl-D-alanine carboxypeptidase family protein [Serpentinicella sp. ANB-PHB4]|uniref:D-alanyl-D-alanine carboxypeptidase family protein n=1 Tax=Serpentinicella sp. ANB-PHB4 TaxID=3074076 RepID=UPI0028675716|nr:D-alanyl-D-alanine carboxypeptidase family protein [Serpentinicella sp. ANB-PHB4]MDR5659605.1 D-alanyl-D-alanine carboxypeptidase family protein [Serpentinicella sp. ANB-PHB4]